LTLLLHAILAADARPAPEPALVRVPGEHLAAWLSTRDGQQALGRADMLAHHELVARLCAQSGACLPARFPTIFSDAEAVRRVLIERQAQLLKGLEHVRDRAELAVTALWVVQRASEPIAVASPGRRFMLERQQAFRSADALRTAASEIADDLESRLGSKLVEARRKICPRPDTALSLALLVPRASAAALARRVPDTDERHGVRILVNGPWPPYSFAALAVKEA
jgi:Gas vesicle synthesis protein GvpL/GvpF